MAPPGTIIMSIRLRVKAEYNIISGNLTFIFPLDYYEPCYIIFTLVPTFRFIYTIDKLGSIFIPKRFPLLLLYFFRRHFDVLRKPAILL